MVVITTSTSPAARLRVALLWARDRDEAWELAWRRAVVYGLVGLRGDERKAWSAALGWSQRFWRAAYLGEADALPYWPIYAE